MKKFITKMQQERTPHERRQFALTFAGGITAVLFVAWLATLGARVAFQNEKTAQKQNSQSAAVVNSYTQTNNTLQVATSSVYQY